MANMDQLLFEGFKPYVSNFGLRANCDPQCDYIGPRGQKKNKFRNALIYQDRKSLFIENKLSIYDNFVFKFKIQSCMNAI